MGPRRFDKHARKTWLLLIADGMPKMAAAKEVGFTWETVRSHLNNDPDFYAEYEYARVAASEPVEMVLREAAMAGDPWAVKMWLESHIKDVYSPKQVIEVNQHHTVEIDAGNAREEIEKLQARLQERKQVAIEAGSGVIDAEVIE